MWRGFFDPQWIGNLWPLGQAIRLQGELENVLPAHGFGYDPLAQRVPINGELLDRVQVGPPRGHELAVLGIGEVVFGVLLFEYEEVRFGNRDRAGETIQVKAQQCGTTARHG